MPIREIAEPDPVPWTWKFQPCRDPEHNPPTHIVLPPGTYENVCSSCGFVTRFQVGAVSICNGVTF